MVEADLPLSLFSLDEGYGFADQSCGDIYEVTAPLDLAVGANLPDGGLGGIDWFWRRVGKLSVRWPVEGGRRQLSQFRKRMAAQNRRCTDTRFPPRGHLLTFA